MKQRAAELRGRRKEGAKKADARQAVLDSIAAMGPDDRALAERVHATGELLSERSRAVLADLDDAVHES
jgi:hypothetical protein